VARKLGRDSTTLDSLNENLAIKNFAWKQNCDRISALDVKSFPVSPREILPYREISLPSDSSKKLACHVCNEKVPIKKI
jgi:hypothetical protein